MTRNHRLVWLGLTPEPERELPVLAAALRGVSPDEERALVQGLVMRGTQEDWLRYLAGVGDLAVAVLRGGPGDREAALACAQVLFDHHRLLIGLPGPGYDATAGQRAALSEVLEVTA